jgi:hypothetical protein
MKSLIYCLLFEDYVPNCAETASKLQQQINVVEQFCNNNDMEINLDKTEIVVFRNDGPLRRYITRAPLGGALYARKWFFF